MGQLDSRKKPKLSWAETLILFICPLSPHISHTLPSKPQKTPSAVAALSKTNNKNNNMVCFSSLYQSFLLITLFILFENDLFLLMKEGQEPDVAVAKKRTFKKFSFRGVDLDALLDMSTDELVKMFTARARRRYIYIFIKVLFRVLVFFGNRVFILFYLGLFFLFRFQRGLKRKPMALIKKLRKAVCFLLHILFSFLMIVLAFISCLLCLFGVFIL